jgi:hypothetical protein
LIKIKHNKNPRSLLRGIPSAALIDFAASSGESDPKRLKLTPNPCSAQTFEIRGFSEGKPEREEVEDQLSVMARIN